jgi:hypothetical protein
MLIFGTEAQEVPPKKKGGRIEVLEAWALENKWVFSNTNKSQQLSEKSLHMLKNLAECSSLKVRYSSFLKYNPFLS